jgi:hypothetical protein
MAAHKTSPRPNKSLKPFENRALRRAATEPRIMYVEARTSDLAGTARIGRVTYSRTGGTLYYLGLSFQAIKGKASKANHEEIISGDHYWIAAANPDGKDRPHGGPAIVEIDEDAREEYWTTIRQQPESASQATV